MNAIRETSLCSDDASYQPVNAQDWTFFLGYGADESSSVASARRRMQLYSPFCSEIGHGTVQPSDQVPFLATLLWANCPSSASTV